MPEQSPSRRTQNSKSCRARPVPGTRKTTSSFLDPVSHAACLHREHGTRAPGGTWPDGCARRQRRRRRLGYGGREWGELLVTGRLGRLWELAATYGARSVVRGVARDAAPAGRPPHPAPAAAAEARPISSAPSDTSIRRCASGSGRSTTSAGVRRSASGAGGSSGRSCPSRPCAWRSTSCAAPATASTFAIPSPTATSSSSSCPCRPRSRATRCGRRLSFEMRSPDTRPTVVVERLEKPEYLSVLERRVDRGLCLDWIRESDVRLPFVNYETLFRRRIEQPGSAPLPAPRTGASARLRSRLG